MEKYNNMSNDFEDNNDAAAKRDTQNNDVLGQAMIDHADAMGVEAKVMTVNLKNNNLLSSNVLRTSIEDFFKKPWVLQSGSFATTDTATTFPAIYMPSGALNLNASYREKLKGFYGIRADMHFILQVNANRFQAGRYMLVWLPTCGSTSLSSSTDDVYAMNTFSLVQRSQLPHAEIDVNCETHTKLSVPYLSARPTWSVANTIGGGIGDLGIIRIHPYSPLVSPAGSTDCKYTLWVYFDNITLTGNTVFQSSEWKPRMKGKSKTIQDREAESAGLGPVSSVTTKVSKSLRIMGEIPFLAPFTGTAAWFSDLVGDVAKVWGFSKPLARNPANCVQRVMASDFNHVDGASLFSTLAPTSTQELELLPDIGLPVEDEMAFSYLFKKPSWFRTFGWSTTDTVGTIIQSIDVHPLSSDVSLVDSGVTTTNKSPVSYVSTFFSYWRGSLVYRFKVVKTEFHSGRLLFVYNPRDVKAPPGVAASIPNSNTALRMVVDIREGVCFDIAVPYMAIENYSLVRPVSPLGVLTVIVLDPLVAPSTVSNTVSFLTEIYAGDDYEVAFPRVNELQPYRPLSAQSGTWLPGCEMISDVIGGAEINTDLIHSRACIGEKINSMRQMIKMNIPLAPKQTSPATASNSLRMFPWHWGYSKNVLSLPTQSFIFADYFSHLSVLYAGVRGSVNLTCETNQNVYVNAYPVFDSVSFSRVLDTSLSVSSFDNEVSELISPAITKTLVTGYSFVNVPYRCRTPFSSTIDTSYDSTSTTTFRTVPDVVATFYLRGSTTPKAKLYRSGGDDIHFFRFKSCPPLVNNIV